MKVVPPLVSALCFYLRETRVVFSGGENDIHTPNGESRAASYWIHT